MISELRSYENPDQALWDEMVLRPEAATPDITTVVDNIMSEVRKHGDDALVKYTHQFDQAEIDAPVLAESDWERGLQMLSDDLREAIDLAARNIQNFHEKQGLNEAPVETMPGVRCWRQASPIDRVGIYVPGGTAPLFSTVLMLAIPARIAGCEQVVMCTPPQEDGSVHPAMLYAARISGVTQICRIGGAQAIAALAFGTDSIPKVHKIFGPGNHFVTEAKLAAQRYGIAIDMPAGPSEVLVLADATARPDFIAADMISQAEHGADSQVVLVTTHQSLIEKTRKALEQQLADLPRKAIAETALGSSMMVYFDDLESAIAFSNHYAPEHLILSLDNPHSMLHLIRNAGSVFVGHYSPESVGDYASGTNHTLPTNGWARAYSGVSLDSFTKRITFQELTREGIKQIGPAVETMARAELLEGHQRAVSIRLKNL